MDDRSTETPGSDPGRPPTGNARRLVGRALDVLVLIAAVVGLGLAVDGFDSGTSVHRIVAIAIGLVLCLPALAAFPFGRRARRRGRRVLFSALMALFACGLLELGFRALGAWHEPQRLAADPVLGLVGVPGTGDLDQRGFRNERALEQADVVVLGDSNTHGFRVLRHETFPSALANRSDWSVYNMSQGGYGPLQYLGLIDSALELSPRAVVVAFYFGNDLVDAHRYLSLDHWRALRDPAFPPPKDSQFIAESGTAPNLAMEGVDWLREHSHLAGYTMHVVSSRMRESEMLGILGSHDDVSARYDDADVSTVFTPAYRLPVVDGRRPAVKDGLRVTAHCFREIAERCRERSAVPVLLLLPTKEWLYAHWLGDRDAAEPLRELRDREDEVRQVVLRTGAEAGFEIVDPAERFRQALDAGRQLYWTSADGHLAPGGLELTAEILEAELRRVLDR